MEPHPRVEFVAVIVPGLLGEELGWLSAAVPLELVGELQVRGVFPSFSGTSF